ncbi:response regulator [Terrimonas sp. NA20]|uniref:Response regulator n=1 Tax=Terrimonas ginsenosidimutans TaxID=2908004 RepID=A0ABS9KQK9_9BACT|nr:response regulator [Terrimonas ginsenosidimutans]MCG2614616.1 response regulator [Terrimonas ginsenosidimutans]
MPDIKKIFILDDEEEILELLARILGNQYSVFTKSNTEGIEQDLMEFKPDVIMIDHFMGDTTSKEILTQALGSFANVPVILHSAHEDIEKLSFETKVAGFIRKPSGIREIREKVAEILER